MKFSSVVAFAPLSGALAWSASTNGIALQARDSRIGTSALLGRPTSLSRRDLLDILDIFESQRLQKRIGTPHGTPPSTPKLGANAPSLPASPSVDKQVKDGRVVADDNKAVGIHDAAPGKSGPEGDFVKA